MDLSNFCELYIKKDVVLSFQGVDIIVFPEIGITGFNYSKPTDIESYLEYIPDPTEIDWTPCTDPKRFSRTKVQTFLSCLAKDNSLYLVANYGDAQPCSSDDPHCPENGQYQYNTNIVFNRNGKLVARYHKQHLFYENQYQEPSVPEMITFDTEFGRFGTFTCFDILFHDPAIPLVERFNITDVVFPTAWMDALPYFSAIGYHSSFAVAYNVNFLASNIHLPGLRFQGSGIYTPDGPIVFRYNSVTNEGRLLVDQVPIRNRNSNSLPGNEFLFGSTQIQFLKDPDFKAQVFHDWYNFVNIGSRIGNVTVCMREFCCHLSHERDQMVGNYAFGVFNGMHEYEGKYYLQICILLQCASHNNIDCGKVTYNADDYFSFFNIRGNFTTRYVTPQIISSNNGSLQLPPLRSTKFDKNGLTGSATSAPLLETALIGRIYHVTQSDVNASISIRISCNLEILVQLISVIYFSFF